MFEKIKSWYKKGLWTEEHVMQAVKKGKITAEQAEKILNQEG